MSLSTNTDAICNDVYECLSSNGINLKKDCVFIDNSSGELFVKALTEDSPSRQFSMKIGDDSIVCDDDNSISFDMSPFKKVMEFSDLSEEELLETRTNYYSYLVEIGEMTEEEMEEALKS